MWILRDLRWVEMLHFYILHFNSNQFCVPSLPPIFIVGPECSSTTEVQQTGSSSLNCRVVVCSLLVLCSQMWPCGGGGCSPCSGSHKLDLLVGINEPRRCRSYIWWVQGSPALVTIQISLGAKTCSNSVRMGSLRLCLWTLLQISHGINDGLTLTRCWWGHPGGQLNLNEPGRLDLWRKRTDWPRRPIHTFQLFFTLLRRGHVSPGNMSSEPGKTISYTCCILGNMK